MSRAEPDTVPSQPRLVRAIRDAGVDFYYNVWAFLGANVLIGALLLAALYGSLLLGPWLLALAALVAVPAAGTMRMATRLRRDGHTDLGDFAEVLRHPGRIVLPGALQLAIGVVLIVDVAVALGWGGWLGTLLLVGALYGLAAWWAVAVIAWPILLDPHRNGRPTRACLRLALVTLLVYPIRVITLAVTSGLFLIVAAILIAPILTFAVSLAWLAVAGYVLPLVDRVESRLGQAQERKP